MSAGLGLGVLNVGATALTDWAIGCLQTSGAPDDDARRLAHGSIKARPQIAATVEPMARALAAEMRSWCARPGVASPP